MAQIAWDQASALMAKIAEGNVDAYVRLYDEMARPVYGIARVLLQDDGLAEEVTQEVFLTVWQTASRYDQARGAVHTWVLTMAHRRAVDRVRGEEACRRRSVRYAQRRDRSYDEVVETVAAILEGAEVKAALDDLSPLQRESITLAYYGGYSYSEVASLLDVPLGTVKARIRDGLIRMRRALVNSEEALG